MHWLVLHATVEISAKFGSLFFTLRTLTYVIHAGDEDNHGPGKALETSLDIIIITILFCEIANE